ncbi:MAG: hypothetical protein NTV07_06165 [Candidatus Omnitrophica bacterium]|nr:hypothetical protein [Candidatus Omnitrophota bacterium]
MRRFIRFLRAASGISSFFTDIPNLVMFRSLGKTLKEKLALLK